MTKFKPHGRMRLDYRDIDDNVVFTMAIDDIILSHWVLMPITICKSTEEGKKT